MFYLTVTVNGRQERLSWMQVQGWLPIQLPGRAGVSIQMVGGRLVVVDMLPDDFDTMVREQFQEQRLGMARP